MTTKATQAGFTVRFTKKEILDLQKPKKTVTKNYYAEVEVWGVPLVFTLGLGELKIQSTPTTAYGFAKPKRDPTPKSKTLEVVTVPSLPNEALVDNVYVDSEEGFGYEPA